jgi:hypothetical protein
MAITYNVPLVALMGLISQDYPQYHVSDLHRGIYTHFDAGLLDDIQCNGIIEPLRVVNNYLVNGHHRIIIAKELALLEVPITYSGYLDKMPGK